MLSLESLNTKHSNRTHTINAHYTCTPNLFPQFVIKQYNTSCTSSSAVVHDKPHDTASSSENVNEPPITHHIDSDGIMAEGSSMECLPEHNNDNDGDKQSDMDTREQEDEGQDVEMQHPPMPSPFMPPPRRMRYEI